MRRRDLLRAGLASTVAGALPGGAAERQAGAAATGREIWVGHLDRVAKPVLEALAAERLRATMPIEMRAGRDKSRPRT